MSATSDAQNAAGIDIIEIERVEAALGKFGERFLRRVYTAEEAAFCRGRVHELAARVAAEGAGGEGAGRGGEAGGGPAGVGAEAERDPAGARAAPVSGQRLVDSGQTAGTTMKLVNG